MAKQTHAHTHAIYVSGTNVPVTDGQDWARYTSYEAAAEALPRLQAHEAEIAAKWLPTGSRVPQLYIGRA